MPLDINVLKAIPLEVLKKPRVEDYANSGLLAWICIERLVAEPVLSALAGCWDCDDLYENGAEKSVSTS